MPRALAIALSCGARDRRVRRLLPRARPSCSQLPEARARARRQRLHLDRRAGAVFSAELAFLLDPLSAVMMLVVTGVGSLIHIYSIGYMDDDHREDGGFQRFFCYLNLFTVRDAGARPRRQPALMFVGWEGVGLCSYLLIGFWYGDRWNAYCGSKAFIVNRIGDFGFLLGIFLLFWSLARRGTPTVELRRDQGRASPRSSSRPSRCPAGCPFGPETWRLAHADRRSASSSAPAASPRRFRSTSGCPTRWPARRRSRR